MRLLCPTVLLVLAAACGSSRAAPAGIPNTVSLSGEDSVRGCAVIAEPVELPAVEEVVDSAGLSAHTRDLWRGGSLPQGVVLFALEYDADGSNIRRDVIEHTTRTATADSLQRLVFAHRRRAEERPTPWGVRLRIEADSTKVIYEVARQEYCAPRPRDSRFEATLYGDRSPGVRYRGGVRERTVVMRVLVHPSGYVQGGQAVRGVPQGSSLEQNLVNWLRQFAFYPALRDGKPVPGWIEVPVVLRS